MVQTWFSSSITFVDETFEAQRIKYQVFFLFDKVENGMLLGTILAIYRFLTRVCWCTYENSAVYTCDCSVIVRIRKMSWYCWGTPSECTAIRKFVRRSPCVNTNMTSQFPWVRKRLRALRTVVWLLSSVGTNTYCKVAWTGEWLRTARTCVKFLACVNTNMIYQSTLIRKLFMISRTLIWLLTTVSANMPCQVTWLREWFRTVRTRIMVSHQYDMIFELGRSRKQLLTL